MQPTMKASTERLFEAYHAACNAVGDAAIPLYKQALADCEACIVEALESWETPVLRSAASGMEGWILEDLLEEIVDNSRFAWTFEGFQAQAVFDGADRLGIAAQHLDAHADTPCEQARQILTGVFHPQLEGMAESVLQARDAALAKARAEEVKP